MGKSVTYTCTRSPDWETVIQSKDSVYDHRGRKIEDVPRIALTFSGFKSVVEESKDGNAVVNGREQPISYDEFIDQIEGSKKLDPHRLLGSAFYKEKKVKGESLDSLRKKAKKADHGELRRLLNEEQAGKNRSEALGIIANALAENPPEVVESNPQELRPVSPDRLPPELGPENEGESAPDWTSGEPPRIAGDPPQETPDSPEGDEPGTPGPEPLRMGGGPPESTPDSPGDDSDVDATDAAREEAASRNLNLSEIKGTGEDGRITVGDVRSADGSRS
jgi:hypothetical protein